MKKAALVVAIPSTIAMSIGKNVRRLRYLLNRMGTTNRLPLTIDRTRRTRSSRVDRGGLDSLSGVIGCLQMGILAQSPRSPREPRGLPSSPHLQRRHRRDLAQRIEQVFARRRLAGVERDLPTDRRVLDLEATPLLRRTPRAQGLQYLE